MAIMHESQAPEPHADRAEAADRAPPEASAAHDDRRAIVAAPDQPRYSPLLLVLIAAGAGIVLDRQAAWSLNCWLAGAWALLTLWLFCWQRGLQQIASICLLGAVAAGFGGWHHQHWHLRRADDIACFAGESGRPAAIRAIARSSERRLPVPPFDPLKAMQGGERTRIEVEVLAIRDRTQWRSASGRMLLTIDGRPPSGVEYGDELLIFGQFGRLAPAGNPGDIDFAAMARAEGRLCWLHCNTPAAVSMLSPGSPWSPQRWLGVVQRHCSERIQRHLSYEQAGFAAALLLGDRAQLDPDRAEAFFHTNTVHFLAISGMHVAAVASCLLLGLRIGLLPQRGGLAAVAICTLGYTLLTDAPPSAVRAAVLVLCGCGAMVSGRPLAAFNALGLGGLIVLIWNPADLFRIGPQLSFLAVAVLAWFGPIWFRWQQQDALERLIARTRPAPIRFLQQLGRWYWRSSAVSAAVWLATLPLVLSYFHLVSPAAIVLTPLLTWPVAAGLMSGFAMLVLGSIHPALARPVAACCDASLASVDLLVRAAERIPYTRLWAAGPDGVWIAVFYLGAAAWVAFPQHRPRSAISATLLALWLALASWSALAPRQTPGELRCTFLSMGHGCCVVVELPDGSVVMYDAGRLNSPAGAARSAAGFLWNRRIRHVDALVISHGDVDHYNAVPRLLRQFDMPDVYVSTVMFRERGSLAIAALEKSLEAQGARVQMLWDGHDLAERLSSPSAGAPPYRIAVLHPDEAGLQDSDNANSIVLAIEYAGRRVLLTGDVENSGLRRLHRLPPLACDVVLAPHHGSTRSDPPGFVAWSSARHVVISGGRPDDRGDASSLFARQGAEVWHTALDGAVTVVIAADGELSIAGHLSPQRSAVARGAATIDRPASSATVPASARNGRSAPRFANFAATRSKRRRAVRWGVTFAAARCD